MGFKLVKFQTDLFLAHLMDVLHGAGFQSKNVTEHTLKVTYGTKIYTVVITAVEETA